MKTFRFATTLLIALLLLLNSCGKITDEDTPWQLQSLPVVFSVISPNKAVQVSLSHTFVAGQKQDTIYYPEAKVFVSGEDKEWVELARESYEKAMYSDTAQKISIEEGKSYHLRVELPDIILEAQSTLPSDKGHIIYAEYQHDPSQSDEYQESGVLRSKLKLPEANKCALFYESDWGIGASPFVNSESIVEIIYPSKDTDTINLMLVTMDPYLERYWMAEAIRPYQMFYGGDVSPILGMYNGLIPPYSNIKNGIGLFGSFLSDKTIVSIER